MDHSEDLPDRVNFSCTPPEFPIDEVHDPVGDTSISDRTFNVEASSTSTEFTSENSTVPSLGWSSNSSVFSQQTTSTSESTKHVTYARSSQPFPLRDFSLIEIPRHENHSVPARSTNISPWAGTPLADNVGHQGVFIENPSLQEMSANLHAMSQNQLLDLQRDLQELSSQVDDLIHQPSSASSLLVKAKSSIDVFRCVLCQRDIKTRGALMRHIQSIHYPSHSYSCREKGCNRVTQRRGDLISHYHTAHQRTPQEGEVAAGKYQNSCPPVCTICPLAIHGWNGFYKCLMSHCLKSPGQSGRPNDLGAKNRKRSNNPLQVDEPPDKPKKRQNTRVVVSPAVVASQETHLALDSLPTKSGKTEPEMKTLMKPSEIEEVVSKLRDTARSSTAPDKEIASIVPSKANYEDQQLTRPLLDTVDSNTNRSSQPSDDDEARSTQTNITRPDVEDEIDLDYGVADSGDMEHILNPGAYYRKLDLLEQKTAELCGIACLDFREFSLEECANALERCIKALENLQKEGFCEDSFTILVQDRCRPDIASTARITNDTLDDALKRVTIMSVTDEDRLAIGTRWWPLLRSLLGIEFPEDTTWEALDYLQFLANAMKVGLLSFSGSHVCRFDKNVWGEDMKTIPVWKGYAFTLQELACLKDFVGGPAWILGKNQQLSQESGLKISLTVKDLQELWGPIWFMGGGDDDGTFLRTEAGYIIPLPRDQQPDSSLAEIECHWSSSYAGHETENPILLTSSSQILIGTEPTIAPCFTVNETCPAQIAALQTRIRSHLQPAGVHKGYAIFKKWGFHVQAGMGKLVQAGGELTYKRIPGRNWKTTIIASCIKGNVELKPLLGLNVGLEVSACTGNARRVKLWDALRLSQTMAPWDIDNPAQEEDLPPCPHRIADLRCIESCWTRLTSQHEIDSFHSPPPTDQLERVRHFRRVILDTIIALANTGVDHKENLQVYWPFTGTPRTHCIEITSASGGVNNWLRVVKDSECVATFAVASQRCIEARYEHGRRCTPPGQGIHPTCQQTTLYTWILPKHPLESNCPERNQYFDLGEAALVLQRVLPIGNENVLIAEASGTALKNGWIKSVKVGRRQMFQEDLDLELSRGNNKFPLLIH